MKLKRKIKITNLQPYGNGWSWNIATTYASLPYFSICRTDSSGKGLYFLTNPGRQWIQIDLKGRPFAPPFYLPLHLARKSAAILIRRELLILLDRWEADLAAAEDRQDAMRHGG